MTELARISDHTPQALGLLIDQYQGLPRLSGLVASYVNRIQEFEDTLWDVLLKRLLDYTALDGSSQSAAGEQLEALGRLVGRGRNGQNDATYLAYVRAQIFLNKSRARRGDIVALIRLVEAVTPFIYTEFYPGVVYLEFLSIPVTAPATLADLAQRAVTGGVRLYLIAQAQSHPFLLGDDTVGGQIDPLNGLSNEAESTGGYLAGIW